MTNPEDETPAESDHEDTSTSGREEHDSGEPGEITDDMLPEDLQPSEDNPLAKGPGAEDDEEEGGPVGGGASDGGMGAPA